MFKKLFSWVKSIFVPVKIETSKVDEYINSQKYVTNVQDPQKIKEYVETNGLDVKSESVRFTESKTRKLGADLKEDEFLVSVDIDKKTVKVSKLEKVPPKKAKPLNEKLKEVELPVYAQGKKLPPKAKRKFIKEAQNSAARSGTSQVNSNNDVALTAGVLGGIGTYAAVMASDEPSRSCSSSSYSSSYESSSSSYDSSSYDSGSSCD
jgi:hypothetical protein